MIGVPRLGVRHLRGRRIVVYALVVEGLLFGVGPCPLDYITGDTFPFALVKELLEYRLD